LANFVSIDFCKLFERLAFLWQNTLAFMHE